MELMVSTGGEQTGLCRDQSAHQRCACPTTFRRHQHAPPRCIPGRRGCGPATPQSDDNGSLRQGGLRSVVRDRTAMAGGTVMLIAHAERYISLRQTLGYKLHDLSSNLSPFARFPTDRGDTHVRISTVMDWATEASS